MVINMSADASGVYHGKTCPSCETKLKEVSRTYLYVFYECSCNKSVWDRRRTLLHDGEEYVLGTAGSIVHECHDCQRQKFREQFEYVPCLWCGGKCTPLLAKNSISEH